MRTFVRVWLTGYASPAKFSAGLKDRPAPHWGLCAQVLRSLMDSLLLYLPLAIMGREPPTPSYFTFIPTASYYTTLIWLTPLVFMTQWLLGAAVSHVYLRLRHLSSDVDQILNITGMASLVVSTVLIAWDWLWFFAGGMNQYILGISHLLIDAWWFVIVVAGYKQLLGVPVRSCMIMTLLAFAAVMPFAVIFMRAPF